MRIFHTNDMHSNYDFLRRVHGYLSCHRQPGDLYFDSGDYTDIKSILVDADKGVSAMEVLRFAGLDLMTLGNNEIDMGYEAVTRLLALGAPIVCANVLDGQGQPLPGLPGSVTLEVEGRRLLVVGLAPFYAPGKLPGRYNVFYLMGNLQTTEPVEALTRELESKTFDDCLLLSHSGVAVDEMLMEKFPCISLCFGGHSHDILTRRGYSQSGMGQRLGCVTLHQGQETDSVQLELPEMDNPDFDAFFRQRQQRAEALLSRELPVLRELSYDPFGECGFLNFICDCLLDKFGGDFALMHNGIATAALLRPVSRMSLLTALPSKLNPTRYQISGDCLRQAILLSQDPKHIRQSGRGAGFRGTVLGTLSFSHNVRLRGSQIWINGEPLQDDREYSIVTDDYLQRGTGYPSLRVPDAAADYDVWFIRDLVQAYLQVPGVFETAQQPRRVGGEAEACQN